MGAGLKRARAAARATRIQPGTAWRRRDGERVLVTKVRAGIVTFHTEPFLIQYERSVAMFLRNHKPVGPSDEPEHR